jgi:seryl-tRNA synthetase
VEKLIALDENRRKLLYEAEQLKSTQNIRSKQIPVLKKEGNDVTDLMNEMKLLSDRIKEMDSAISEIDIEIEAVLYSIPNIPNDKVPTGKDSDSNIEMRKWGTPRVFSFEAKPHWDLGENLGILDFASAVKVTGSRFTFYRGAGARLERALINFMLDLHTEKHGYEEIFPPYMVNRDSMVGTGQLPKFEEDAFKVAGTDYFMIPTAEVPVTNMYKQEILQEQNLPLKMCAYSACFRAEAGSAGRDTRGLIRQHQFNKVELVKLSKPEDSYEELEKLTNDAENVLKTLNLPYRVMMLCTGDLGFASAMTYDLEVWMPSYGKYVEISSCSNFESFQARRANIRYRKSVNEKPEFVHTLNGSGVAVGRTVACILENYQLEDGSIEIPEALRKYMNGLEVIKEK